MRLSSLLVILVIVGIAAAAFLRPAIVLGTNTDAVAASLMRELPDSSVGGGEKLDPNCIQTADRNYTCRAGYFDGSNQVETDYGVELGRFGCWDATPLQSGSGEPLGGCIWIVDY